MAKRFFYVCAGLFLLALSYHLGASSAGANGRRIVTRELVVTEPSSILRTHDNSIVYLDAESASLLGPNRISKQ